MPSGPQCTLSCLQQLIPNHLLLLPFAFPTLLHPPKLFARSLGPYQPSACIEAAFALLEMLPSFKQEQRDKPTPSEDQPGTTLPHCGSALSVPEAIPEHHPTASCSFLLLSLAPG